MATEVETRVMQILSSIEMPKGTAQRIEAMGTEAVTVVCEAALGSFVGQRPSLRNNAATLIGRMSHVQAVETLALLISSDSPSVARRALRAMRRRRRDDLVPAVQGLLEREHTPPTLAAEAVLALAALESDPAREALASYKDRTPLGTHRASPVVRRALARVASKTSSSR
jgi:hypothetical protein